MLKSFEGRKLSHNLIILYEDSYIIVVNKPAGLLSIATGTEKQRTVYWILSEYLWKKGEKRRVAAVHRLDRDTSGVMLFAKSAVIKRRLMQNWNALVVERRYIALAEGDFSENEGLIDLPIGEDKGGKPAIRKNGMRSVTRWKRLRAGKGCTLLALELETGRRNQIRLHLSAIGHPVLGDIKFGGKPGKRLYLHAETLVFHHPRRDRLMRFEVKAPFDIKM
jgi:RluA family pseudouridine synthase